MKRLFCLILALVATCHIARSSQPSTDEGEATTTFTIDIYNITTTSATAKVTPSNNNTLYYYGFIIKEGYKSYSTPAEFAASQIEMIQNWANQNGYSLSDLLKQGVDSRESKNLKGDTEYFVYAFGITADGKQSTEVALKAFTTLPYADEPSNNTFSIDVSKITDHGARVEIIPSNNDPYYFHVVEKAEYEKFENDEEFAHSVVAELRTLTDKIDYTRASGNKHYVFNALLKPNTDYYAFAFGMSGNGVPTTGVTKRPFKTLAEKSDELVRDYYVRGFSAIYEKDTQNSSTTWSVALFAETEINIVVLDINLPITATDFVGRYELSSSRELNTANVGSMVDGAIYGSYWSLSDKFYNMIDYKLLSSGSMDISKSGDIYTIKIDALDHNGKRFLVEYSGTIRFRGDMSDSAAK